MPEPDDTEAGLFTGYYYVTAETTTAEGGHFAQLERLEPHLNDDDTEDPSRLYPTGQGGGTWKVARAVTPGTVIRLDLSPAPIDSYTIVRPQPQEAPPDATP